MKRIINTDNKKLELTKTYSQEQKMKPNGLWYAINDEWIKWCEDNMNHWIKDFLIELEIDLSKILVIQTPQQLKDLCTQFNYEICAGIEYIDWSEIAKIYSGIEIRNYYELKWNKVLLLMMNPTWFYAWDVSSGCIWDLSIIKSFNCYTLKKIGIYCRDGFDSISSRQNERETH